VVLRHRPGRERHRIAGVVLIVRDLLFDLAG